MPPMLKFGACGICCWMGGGDTGPFLLGDQLFRRPLERLRRPRNLSRLLLRSLRLRPRVRDGGERGRSRDLDRRFPRVLGSRSSKLWLKQRLHTNWKYGYGFWGIGTPRLKFRRARSPFVKIIKRRGYELWTSFNVYRLRRRSGLLLLLLRRRRCVGDFDRELRRLGLVSFDVGGVCFFTAIQLLDFVKFRSLNSL